MKFHKFLSIILLSSILISCGSNSGQKKSDFTIKINTEKNKISNNQSLQLSIDNPKQHSIESVVYKLNGNTISENADLSNQKLGKQTIEATITFDGESQTAKREVTIVNNEAPKVYTYKILNEYPHDVTSYTQGLEFYNGELYESTGQRGSSKLRKVNYKTGEVLKNIDLAKEYFGEGLTVLNNNIYQLTWLRTTGFVYDVETFEKKSSFRYGQSKEGWGLCNDGTQLYKSDGTDRIWTLNPETLGEKTNIQVYTNNGKIGRLNELEWVNGKIYANIYERNGVAIINPVNGAVEGVIDFNSLVKLVPNFSKDDNVLNGIAYNPETKTIFVTGKRWDKLFEIEIIEK